MKIKVHNSEKDCSFENISILISKLIYQPIEKYVILIICVCFKLKKASLECIYQQQQKFKPEHCVLECSE